MTQVEKIADVELSPSNGPNNTVAADIQVPSGEVWHIQRASYDIVANGATAGDGEIFWVTTRFGADPVADASNEGASVVVTGQVELGSVFQAPIGRRYEIIQASNGVTTIDRYLYENQRIIVHIDRDEYSSSGKVAMRAYGTKEVL
jgi:hypothetical protein